MEAAGLVWISSLSLLFACHPELAILISGPRAKNERQLAFPGRAPPLGLRSLFTDQEGPTESLSHVLEKPFLDGAEREGKRDLSLLGSLNPSTHQSTVTC